MNTVSSDDLSLTLESRLLSNQPPLLFPEFRDTGDDSLFHSWLLISERSMVTPSSRGSSSARLVSYEITFLTYETEDMPAPPFFRRIRKFSRHWLGGVRQLFISRLSRNTFIAFLWWLFRRRSPLFRCSNPSGFVKSFIDTGWGVALTVGTVELSLDQLRGNHPFFGPVDIPYFPHHELARHWLGDGFSTSLTDYREYQARQHDWNESELNQALSRFAKTLRQVQSALFPPPVIVPHGDVFLIVDGLHRAAAFFALNSPSRSKPCKRLRCQVMFGPMIDYSHGERLRYEG